MWFTIPLTILQLQEKITSYFVTKLNLTFPRTRTEPNPASPRTRTEPNPASPRTRTEPNPASPRTRTEQNVFCKLDKNPNRTLTVTEPDQNQTQAMGVLSHL